MRKRILQTKITNYSMNRHMIQYLHMLILIPGVLNSTVNIICAVVRLLILESTDFCLYGRSSDLLLLGRLPVVHRADSGRGIV